MKSIAITASVGILLGIAAIAGAQRPATPTMEVYKSPTCGCCAKWVEHVRQAGFTVKVTELDDPALDAFKAKNGVPRTAQSCHTALVGGYVVEGHVPAAEISRLLKEKPAMWDRRRRHAGGIAGHGRRRRHPAVQRRHVRQAGRGPRLLDTKPLTAGARLTSAARQPSLRFVFDNSKTNLEHKKICSARLRAPDRPAE